MILIKPIYKKGDKSECGNYRGISLVTVGSKLLSMILLLDKVIREEQCIIRKLRESVKQIFTLKLIIEKCVSHQSLLVLSFIDYEQSFDSADRRAFAKVYPCNIAVVKVENEVSSWFRIKSGVKQVCVLSPFI